MNKYEILYIVDASISDEEKEKVVQAVTTVVENAGGVAQEPDRWGVRKYTYAINYKTEGYYVLVNFKSEGSFTAELERVFGITEGILRSIVIRHVEDKKTKKEA